MLYTYIYIYICIYIHVYIYIYDRPNAPVPESIFAETACTRSTHLSFCELGGKGAQSSPDPSGPDVNQT